MHVRAQNPFGQMALACTFFKTRTLAAKVVSGGHVRVNANKVSKPSTAVVADTVLTFPQGNQIRVIKIVELGTRRGPPVKRKHYTRI